MHHHPLQQLARRHTHARMGILEKNGDRIEVKEMGPGDGTGQEIGPGVSAGRLIIDTRPGAHTASRSISGIRVMHSWFGKTVLGNSVNRWPSKNASVGYAIIGFSSLHRTQREPIPRV